MEENTTSQLDEILALLDAGVPLEECLARCPERAGELRPYLELVLQIRAVPRPAARAAAFEAGKQRMLQALSEKRQHRVSSTKNPNPSARRRWFLPRPVLAAAALAVLLIAGGLLLQAWMQAEAPRAASLSRVIGRVEILPPGSDQWQPALAGEQLLAGTRIRTAQLSAATLAFFDGSATHLDAETEVVILRLNSRRSGQNRVIVLYQQLGSTYNQARPSSDPGACFEIVTPSAHTAVRGTEFAVVVGAEGATRVVVVEGLVDVTGQETTVSVHSDHETTVQPQQPPEPATPAPVLPSAPTTLAPQAAVTPPAPTPSATAGREPASTAVAEPGWPIYALAVDGGAEPAVARPGETVVHVLQVANTGSQTDTFAVAVSGNLWATEVVSSTGPLAPGAAATVEVAVAIPPTAPCGAQDAALVTITSQGNGDVNHWQSLTTRAAPVYGIVVAPLTAAHTGDPGTTVTYTLSVSNSGNCTATYDLTLDGNRWPVRAPQALGPLPPGAGAEWTIGIDIPAGAVGSDPLRVTLAHRDAPSLQASSRLTTTAPCLAITGVGLTVSPAGAQAGEPIAFAVETAAGSSPIRYLWNFGDGSSGAGRRLAHSYAISGTYQVVLTAANGCSTVTATQQVRASGEPDIALAVSRLRAALNPGIRTTRMLPVDNAGTARLSWQLTEEPQVPWLRQTQREGTSAPLSSASAPLIFDTFGIGDGVYTTTLAIASNDPDEPLLSVPVVLTVTAACIPVAGADFNHALPQAQEGANIERHLAGDRPGEQVTFTGTVEMGSEPISYTWDFGDGTSGRGQAMTHSYAVSGTYTVRMSAANRCGADAVTYDVWVPGRAGLSVSPMSLSVPLNPSDHTTRTLTIGSVGTARLDWSLAERPEVPWLALRPTGGGIVPASLDALHQGSTAVQLLVDAAGLVEGVYTTTLAIQSNDPEARQVDVAVLLTVTRACIPLGYVDISIPCEPVGGIATLLQGQVLQGSEPVTYSWDLGDGSAGSGATVAHSYPFTWTVQRYTVTLTATNRCPSQAVATQVVTVRPRQIYMPLVWKAYRE
ncbi:MAG: PKD domain-containing protein [Anaerolineae bacterium]|nr:PKD domain-containing protein [Anaerolineae bacterium]